MSTMAPVLDGASLANAWRLSFLRRKHGGCEPGTLAPDHLVPGLAKGFRSGSGSSEFARIGTVQCRQDLPRSVAEVLLQGERHSRRGSITHPFQRRLWPLIPVQRGSTPAATEIGDHMTPNSGDCYAWLTRRPIAPMRKTASPLRPRTHRSVEETTRRSSDARLRGVADGSSNRTFRMDGKLVQHNRQQVQCPCEHVQRHQLLDQRARQRGRGKKRTVGQDRDPACRAPSCTTAIRRSRTLRIKGPQSCEGLQAPLQGQA